MVRAAVAAVGVASAACSTAAAAAAAVEAEVRPVVLVARVQQPAQLLPKTPEAAERKKHDRK